MTNKKSLNKGGFTLIELLVVVLFIGILSSIALPQYTKAVEKSRAAEAQSWLADFVTGESIYYMSSGGYTDTLTNLDVSLPTDVKNFTIRGPIVSGKTVKAMLERNNSSMPYALEVLLTHTEEDGLDTPTRTCYGQSSICNAIQQGNSAWTPGATTIPTYGS